MAGELINKLIAEGWRQQFTASGARLEEAIDNYRWLGFEVRTVSIKELGCDGCNVCFGDESDDSVIIFTRKLNDSNDGELFPDDK